MIKRLNLAELSIKPGQVLRVGMREEEGNLTLPLFELNATVKPPEVSLLGVTRIQLGRDKTRGEVENIVVGGKTDDVGLPGVQSDGTYRIANWTLGAVPLEHLRINLQQDGSILVKETAGVDACYQVLSLK